MSKISSPALERLIVYKGGGVKTLHSLQFTENEIEPGELSNWPSSPRWRGMRLGFHLGPAPLHTPKQAQNALWQKHQPCANIQRAPKGMKFVLWASRGQG